MVSQCPHFGQDTLLDLPLYDIDDEMLVRERLVTRHTLGHFTLGELWCSSNATPQYWYNPAEHARWRRENAHARAVREAAEKAAQEALRCERLEALNRIYRREEILGAAVRAKAERERWHVEREREMRQLAAKAAREHQAKLDREENERIEREVAAKRLAEEHHEWQRKWAIHTSNVERRITHIVDAIDAGSRDREMMRAMLRYMNLGKGLGTKWDAEEFLNFYASHKSSLRDMARSDVERCYLMLRHRNDAQEIIECRSLSLVT